MISTYHSCDKYKMRRGSRADALYFLLYYSLLFIFFLLLIINVLSFVYIDCFSYLYKIY